MTEFETKFSYDERTKELKANKIWTIKGEKEVKKILKSLTDQEKGFKDSIKQIAERLETAPVMTKELQDLKDMLVKLQKIDISEKITKEQRIELVKQKTDMEKNLKEVGIEISKFKKEIGTRIKL